MIDYPNLKKGTVLVKEFFIVAMVPPSGLGFAICGNADDPDHHSPFDTDTIVPCIGTNERTARHNFRLASERARGHLDGKVVLIKFTGGAVECIEETFANGQTALPG